MLPVPSIPPPPPPEHVLEPCSPVLGGECGQRHRRTAGLRRRVCVAGPCGAGEGARAAQTMPAGAERAAGPSSMLSLLSFLVCGSLSVFLSPLPLPPRPLDLRGGKYILMPLGGRSSQGFDGLAAAALQGSLRRLGWPGRAPPVAPGFKCPSLRALPCGSCAGGGLDASPEGSLPPKTPPELKGASRAGSGWLFPFPRHARVSSRQSSLCARGRGSRSVRAAGSSDGPGLAAGGCRSARRRGSEAAPASRPERPPGSRARPRTLFSFSGLFVFLSVFCHLRKGETKQKSLYFFSGLVK